MNSPARVHYQQTSFLRILCIEAKQGIPKNLSSQVLGEVRVDFLGRIPTKTLHFVNRRSELLRKFLGGFG